MRKNTSLQTIGTLLKPANVILMIFLSIFSLGVYIGVWFLNRKCDIEKMDDRKTVPFMWWKLCTAVLIVFLILNIIKNFIFTEYGFLYIESFDTIFTFFMVGLVNYSAFRIAESIEDKTEIEFNRVLLFLFTIFYIQFKTNRMKPIMQ
ncbi:MAG: hypothetical protein ACE3JQ_01075 [Paenisporosarcina sp.]